MKRFVFGLIVGLIGLTPIALSAQKKLPPEIQPPDALDRPLKMHPLFRPREFFRNRPAVSRPSSKRYATLKRLNKQDPWEDPERIREEWEKRKDGAAHHRAVEQALRIPGETTLIEGDRQPFFVGTGWLQIGRGVHYPDNKHTSGRLRWAEYAYDHTQSATVLYVSGSSGGLWKTTLYDSFFVWTPIGDKLPGSPSIGSFQVHRADSRRILAGTGDDGRYPGTGIYKTTNGGDSWTRCPLAPMPNVVYRLHRDAEDASGNTILAATSNGIWRTTNFGDTWNRVYATGTTTDLIQNPLYGDYWYAGAPGVGVLESDDSGQTFHPINGTGHAGMALPIGAVVLAICASAPNYLYALVEQGGNLSAVYRSSDYGFNWIEIRLEDTISGGQGFHSRAIAVNPSNPAHVIVGMAKCIETTNATSAGFLSQTWTARDIGHDDYTRFLFPPTGNEMVVCNDGGYYAYNLSTHVINAEGNLLGLNCQLIGQMEGSRNTPTRLLSGLQDIGIIRTDQFSFPNLTLPGSHVAFTADGGSVSISPDTDNTIAWSGGAYAGAHIFRRFLSTNGGAGVSDITGDHASTGGNVIEQSRWNTTVMFDPTPGLGPVARIFAHSDQYLYFKPVTAGDWARVNNGNPMAGGRIRAFDIANDPTLYCFYTARWNDGELFVCEGNVLGGLAFVNRSPPLPAGSTRADCWFGADRSDLQPNTVYYTTATARPSRAFLSFDRGQNWTDVTGNLTTLLPDAHYYELIAHPSNTNQLFLATSVGLFRSDNFGRNWYRYMNLLPQVADVRCLRIAYDGVTEPLMQIGTWGRGWWQRNLPSLATRVYAGTLRLEDYRARMTEMTLEFRPGDLTERFQRTVTTDGDGGFSIENLPPAHYQVWIKSPKGLAKVVTVDLGTGDVADTFVSLRSGDANNDNSIDVLDLDLLIQAFDLCEGDLGYDSSADFNLDNCVDVLDLDILIRNFDQVGDL